MTIWAETEDGKVLEQGQPIIDKGGHPYTFLGVTSLGKIYVRFGAVPNWQYREMYPTMFGLRVLRSLAQRRG